jgi:ferredoxin
MFKVTIRGRHAGEILLERELAILAAASGKGIAINHRCGGHARCGTCLATVEEGAENLSPMGAAESRILKTLKAGPDQRLICQAWAQGDVTVRVD